MKTNSKFSRLSLRNLMCMSLVAAFIGLGSLSSSAANLMPPPPAPQPQTPGKHLVVPPPPVRPDMRVKKYSKPQGRRSVIAPPKPNQHPGNAPRPLGPGR